MLTDFGAQNVRSKPAVPLGRSSSEAPPAAWVASGQQLGEVGSGDGAAQTRGRHDPCPAHKPGASPDSRVPSARPGTRSST